LLALSLLSCPRRTAGVPRSAAMRDDRGGSPLCSGPSGILRSRYCLDLCRRRNCTALSAILLWVSATASAVSTLDALPEDSLALTRPVFPSPRFIAVATCLGAFLPASPVPVTQGACGSGDHHGYEVGRGSLPSRSLTAAYLRVAPIQIKYTHSDASSLD
jgi:hypothetical protein